MTLARKKIAEVRERLAKATPGPWEASPGGDVCTRDKVKINEDIPELYVRQIVDLPLNDQGRANCDLIAHAPTDLDKLCQALELALFELENISRGENRPGQHKQWAQFALAKIAEVLSE